MGSFPAAFVAPSRIREYLDTFLHSVEVVTCTHKRSKPYRYGHEGGVEAQFQDSTKMREAHCRLARQDDLRYVIISLRLCQQFIFMLMLFRS
jgi:hypothetical protein